MDFAPLLAAGGVLGLFVASGTLLLQIFRESGRMRRERRAEIDELKAENLMCKWQVNGLVNILRHAGIEIPDSLFRREPDGN